MQSINYGEDGTVYAEYIAPTHGLLGLRQPFLTATRGTGIFHTLFQGYEPLVGEIDMQDRGCRFDHVKPARSPPMPWRNCNTAVNSLSSPVMMSMLAKLSVKTPARRYGDQRDDGQTFDQFP